MPKPKKLPASANPAPSLAGPDAARALERIAAALERLIRPQPEKTDFSASEAFIWHAGQAALQPVKKVNRVEIGLLRGIDQVRDLLRDNTERFAKGYAANNALLWGARGMGKSSLVKAAHAEINAKLGKVKGFRKLKLIEIHREDIDSLPALMGILREDKHRFLVFCDDLSFDGQDTSYKSLKAALEGGIEGRPENALFYATSNRRHILAREMVDNERSSAINPGEAVDEKVSLSDRFGLWLGFHSCNQEEYLAMVFGYAQHLSLISAGADAAKKAIDQQTMDQETMQREALEWAITRGARSGRTAWQYIQDLAGRLGKTAG